MSKILPLFPSHTLPITYEAAEEEAAAAASPGARSFSAGPRINNAHARTREENANAMNNYTDNDLHQVARYYCDVFGRRRCAPSILRQITEALAAGMKAATIILCIDAAAEAETPSWAYAAAVIRNCLRDGALTPDDFARRSDRHRARGRGAATGGRQQIPHALNFQQRTYQPGELDYVFVDPDHYK